MGLSFIPITKTQISFSGVPGNSSWIFVAFSFTSLGKSTETPGTAILQLCYYTIPKKCHLRFITCPPDFFTVNSIIIGLPKLWVWPAFA